MDTSNIFENFIENLKISNDDEILRRYKNITKALNDYFYESNSDNDNSVQIGSYGRKTAVNGVSDLDMMFDIPPDYFSTYNDAETNGQSALLQDVRKAILKRYSTTDVRGDGQVVVVSFTNYVIEVCPGFLQSDGSYKYPDSHNGGSWKKTDPIPEIEEIDNYNDTTNENLKRLAKMTRAWKNKCGVKIGGLLIDTLCYEFLSNNTDYHETEFEDYDILVRDFFEYLKDYDKNREFWYSPGSNQKVYKKKSNFITKAKKAYDNIVEAIEKKDNDTVYKIWRKVFGYPFPYPQAVFESSVDYTSFEQYIEQLYPVDIRYRLSINCEVSQPGFRTEFLRNIIDRLRLNKKLRFFIEYTDVPKPYEVKWKVKNEGPIAKVKNNFRGQILNDDGREMRNENSNFGGPHFVECYIIKHGVCVARDRIDVPISNI
jgi:hypothetical protein